MAKLYLTVLLLFALMLANATARNIPSTDHDQVITDPRTNALAPAQNTENVATTASAPAANGAVNDQKNFIGGWGVGGFGGVGGYVGVLPILGGIGGLGGGAGGGLGGLGGAGGLGGVGGLGKAGGIGVGGGIGGVGGHIP